MWGWFWENSKFFNFYLHKHILGNYQENVLCDIVPLEVRYILLGKPWQLDKHSWQLDKHSVHDGLINNKSFTHTIKKSVLCLLTPQQVRKDQIFLKKLGQKKIK